MVRRLLVISALLAATSAFAGPREDTLAGISRCAGLPDDRTFLDCVYGAAQPMRAHLGLPPAPVTQQHLVPPAPMGYAPAPTAGMIPSAAPVYVPPVAAAPRMATAVPPPATRPAPKVGVVDSFLGNDSTANWMEAFSFDSHHLFTVTFSNGQVWRQDASDTARAHWTGRPSDFSIKLAIDATGRSGQLWVRGDTVIYQVHKVR